MSESTDTDDAEHRRIRFEMVQKTKYQSEGTDAAGEGISTFIAAAYSSISICSGIP